MNFRSLGSEKYIAQKIQNEAGLFPIAPDYLGVIGLAGAAGGHEAGEA